MAKFHLRAVTGHRSKRIRSPPTSQPAGHPSRCEQAGQYSQFEDPCNLSKAQIRRTTCRPALRRASLMGILATLWFIKPFLSVIALCFNNLFRRDPINGALAGSCDQFSNNQIACEFLLSRVRVGIDKTHCHRELLHRRKLAVVIE
jgi:hypothetical protein